MGFPKFEALIPPDIDLEDTPEDQYCELYAFSNDLSHAAVVKVAYKAILELDGNELPLAMRVLADSLRGMVLRGETEPTLRARRKDIDSVLAIIKCKCDSYMHSSLTTNFGDPDKAAFFLRSEFYYDRKRSIFTYQIAAIPRIVNSEFGYIHWREKVFPRDRDLGEVANQIEERTMALCGQAVGHAVNEDRKQCDMIYAAMMQITNKRSTPVQELV